MYTSIKTLTKAIILSGALCLTLNIYASDLPKANPEDYGFSSKKTF
jgi:hypothetical protein